MTETRSPEKKSWGCWWVALVSIALVLWAIFKVLPTSVPVEQAKEMAGLEQVRTIAIALNDYAADHDGAYPEGASSTEVFQKLLDGKYVSDPKTFFVLIAGKVPAASNQLSSQNVCFDVTTGATARSSIYLPLVFTTGYDVKYAAGVNAVRSSDVLGLLHGMAVAYRDNSAHFRRAAPDGSVPLVPKAFDAGKETYRQLKP